MLLGKPLEVFLGFALYHSFSRPVCMTLLGDLIERHPLWSCFLDF